MPFGDGLVPSQKSLVNSKLSALKSFAAHASLLGKFEVP